MTPINTLCLSMLLGFFILMKISDIRRINVRDTGLYAPIGYYSVNNKYNLLSKSYKNYDIKPTKSTNASLLYLAIIDKG